MFSKHAISFAVMAMSLASAMAVPLSEASVQKRDFAAGTCTVKIQEDAYENEADSSQPFWLQSQVYDNAGSQVGGLGWTRCAVVDGHQRCQFKSGLKDDMILDPVVADNRPYVQVYIGAGNFRTTDANCKPTVDDEPIISNWGVTTAHRAWDCTFQCW